METNELLQKVADAIIAEPRQFVMTNWFVERLSRDAYRSNPRIYDIPRTIPNCGTAACIAGHVIAIANKMNPREASHSKSTLHVKHEAARALGIDNELASKLFFVENWGHNFRDAYEEATTVEARAKIAYERIMFFIARKQ